MSAEMDSRQLHVSDNEIVELHTLTYIRSRTDLCSKCNTMTLFREKKHVYTLFSHKFIFLVGQNTLLLLKRCMLCKMSVLETSYVLEKPHTERENTSFLNFCIKPLIFTKTPSKLYNLISLIIVNWSFI